MVTGKFTHEALEYARNLSPPIELIDLPKLIDLADRAGIKIVSKSEHVPLHCFPASDLNRLKLKCEPLFNKFLSSPKSAATLFEIVPDRAELVPLYSVHYDINEDFHTSVQLVYSIHTTNQSILVQANKGGGMVKPEITNFVTGTSMHEIKELPDLGCKTERGNFEMDMTTLKTTAKQLIAQRNTKRVRYGARNNRSYSKLCVPSEHNIFIKDIKQVFLPVRIVRLRVLKNDYPTQLIENDVSVNYDSNKIIVCKTCSKEINDTDTPLLCNSCGAITHRPKIFRHHGWLCHDCKKTICKDCSRSKRHYLILRKRVCESCMR